MLAMKSVQEKLVKEINRMRDEVADAAKEKKDKEQVIENLKKQIHRFKSTDDKNHSTKSHTRLVQMNSDHQQSLDTKKGSTQGGSEHFEKTQRQFNPIETPLDSERTPKGQRKRLGSKDIVGSKQEQIQSAFQQKRASKSSKAQVEAIHQQL
mmetsp:Transcript_39262/g.37686  ORF Transcript_39262/g.37686 Transcript_39262/m.37686 type:complete len:152 (+) Transcript_39262:1048-1503(+)